MSGRPEPHIAVRIDNPYNRRIRQRLEIDSSNRNAWQLQKTANGQTIWVGDDTLRTTQSVASSFQLQEDWFLGLLPIEEEM
jgi:hypothetical protein